MTPREMARIALCADPDDMDENWLTGVLTEHVRALLVDFDELREQYGWLYAYDDLRIKAGIE